MVTHATQYQKVLVFAQNKKSADKIFEALSTKFIDTVGVIHSNKSQNFRIRSIEDFDNDLEPEIFISRGMSHAPILLKYFGGPQPYTDTARAHAGTCAGIDFGSTAVKSEDRPTRPTRRLRARASQRSLSGRTP